ncbi:MAG: Arm DNA-binding domain-containing protein [Deltaproteobacteria bacterium]|nr:Arm DNA-binding domain-containing protein [Deltaproteobacteria bacterium]
MSVRRDKRRDPTTGRTRERWMVDVDFQHADGRRERVRKISPVQTQEGAEEYERQLRAALLDPRRPRSA